MPRWRGSPRSLLPVAGANWITSETQLGGAGAQPTICRISNGGACESNPARPADSHNNGTTGPGNTTICLDKRTARTAHKTDSRSDATVSPDNRIHRPGHVMITPGPGNGMDRPGNRIHGPDNATARPGNQLDHPSNEMDSPGNRIHGPDNATARPGNQLDHPGNATNSPDNATIRPDNGMHRRDNIGNRLGDAPDRPGDTMDRPGNTTIIPGNTPDNPGDTTRPVNRTDRPTNGTDNRGQVAVTTTDVGTGPERTTNFRVGTAPLDAPLNNVRMTKRRGTDLIITDAASHGRRVTPPTTKQTAAQVGVRTSTMGTGTDNPTGHPHQSER